MASIKVNIIANIIGKVWAAVIVVLLIPFYIHYLGIESYGLVGFYGTLLGSMAVLDLGLSVTLNRQLARFRSEGGPVNEIRDLTFSLECIYWLIGLVVCFLVIALSGPIANHWIKAENLSPAIVKESILLMGIVIAFQWPISLYNGGLIGLDKQVRNSIITVVMSTLRAGGVLIVLAFYSPTLKAFFIWQAALSAVYVMTLRWSLWKFMPRFNLRPSFSASQVKTIGRFALGMTGISLITFFLSQADKLILSKILPLSQFAYYILAFTIATSIGLIVGPVSITFFPRFSGLVAVGNTKELIRTYHQACRIMASFIFPIGFVLLFFIQDILINWTNNAATTENTASIAQVLILGSICNGIMVIPYNLMIAHGWTKFTIYQNIIAAVILFPLLFVLTKYYGAYGASFVWLTVNAGYVFISQPLMHRKLLKTELRRWYINDTLGPMIMPFLFVILVKSVLVFVFPTFQLNFIGIAIVGMLTGLISLLGLAEARTAIRKFIKPSFGHG